MKNGKSGTSLQLHGFGNTSPKAYGAVVHARVTQRNGDVETHLVMSKTRVAPTKVVSLPRAACCCDQLAITEVCFGVIIRLSSNTACCLLDR